MSKSISLRKAFTSHLKTSATGKFTTAYDKLFQQLNVSLEICLVSLTDVEPYLCWIKELLSPDFCPCGYRETLEKDRAISKREEERLHWELILRWSSNRIPNLFQYLFALAMSHILFLLSLFQDVQYYI